MAFRDSLLQGTMHLQAPPHVSAGLLFDQGQGSCRNTGGAWQVVTFAALLYGYSNAARVNLESI